jgi:ATP-dependent helicase HrpA
VTVPIYALNQVSDERCEWLVPGMLQAKVLALLQEPAPASRARGCSRCPTSRGALRRAALRRGLAAGCAARRGARSTQLPCSATTSSWSMLPPHLFMNLRVVDEHGRQLGMGRHLAALKAELGAQARSAFQALAVLKRPAAAPAAPPTAAAVPGEGKGVQATHRHPRGREAAVRRRRRRRPSATPPGLRRAARADGARARRQVLIGFPALIDRGGCRDRGLRRARGRRARHRAGLRRLVALQLRSR